MMTTTATKTSVRQVLDQLSPEDRNLYESTPDDVDYVANPDFRRAGLEDELFGPDAEVVPAPQWRLYLELDDEAAPLPKSRTQFTRAHECLLFTRYNYARYRLAQVMPQQRRRFARKRVDECLLWYRRSLENRAILAGANMALVVAMAKRTRINTVEFGELVSEGNMALLRAVDRFDVCRGFKLSTYACRAILKSFNRLATNTGTYRQHFPTDFDPELERSDEVDRRHRDQRELAIEDLQRVLALNMAQLTEVERQVVGARFAVAGHRAPQTLEQVGDMVGLSKERVRQVQNDALGKLREAMELVVG